MHKEYKLYKDKEKLIKEVGSQVLTISLDDTMNVDSQELSFEVRKLLNFKTVDTLYYSLVAVQQLIQRQRNYRTLAYRTKLSGLLNEVFR